MNSLQDVIDRLERVIQTGATDKDGMHPISAERVLEELKSISIDAKAEEILNHLYDAVNGINALVDRPSGEWIDVTDELPKQGQNVLAWVETKDDARIACCNYSNSVWFDAIMDVIVSPIAWMPLPMPYHKDERSRR